MPTAELVNWGKLSTHTFPADWLAPNAQGLLTESGNGRDGLRSLATLITFAAGDWGECLEESLTVMRLLMVAKVDLDVFQDTSGC